MALIRDREEWENWKAWKVNNAFMVELQNGWSGMMGNKPVIMPEIKAFQQC